MPYLVRIDSLCCRKQLFTVSRFTRRNFRLVICSVKKSHTGRHQYDHRLIFICSCQYKAHRRGIRRIHVRKAHHVSLAGKLFHKMPYKLMLTYSRNYGTYGAPYTGESQWGKDPGTVNETPLHQVSGALLGEIPLRHFAITWGVYADRGQLLEDNFGAQVGLRYMFELQ